MAYGLGDSALRAWNIQEPSRKGVGLVLVACSARGRDRYPRLFKLSRVWIEHTIHSPPPLPPWVVSEHGIYILYPAIWMNHSQTINLSLAS